jgi:hypothetical protein
MAQVRLRRHGRCPIALECRRRLDPIEIFDETLDETGGYRL